MLRNIPADSEIEKIISLAKGTFIPGSKRDVVKTADSYFSWDAVRINGTHFIAARGPRSSESIPGFLKNIAYNPQISISQIVALGSTLVGRDIKTSARGDFYDYCLIPGKKCYGPYEVEVKNKNGEFKDNLIQSFPYGLVQSEITIKCEGKEEKKLNATIIKLRSSCP